LAFILDRESQKPAIVYSREGGVDIEKVAKLRPDSIFMQILEPSEGISDDVVEIISENLGIPYEAY
jgi:succinyl-CoA synthetase beta subunit